jgi:hypothetical protein
MNGAACIAIRTRVIALLALVLCSVPLHAGGADLAAALAQLESESPETALASLRSLAELGNPAAQRVLGDALLNGKRVTRNDGEGLGWLLAAQENGEAGIAEPIASALSRLPEEQQTLARTYVERFGKVATSRLDPVEGAHVAQVLTFEERREIRYLPHLWGRIVKAARIHGWAYAKFTYIVDENGQVRDVLVSDLIPNNALRPTIAEHYRTKRFNPPKVDGRAVPAAVASGLRLKLEATYPPIDDAARRLIGPASAGDSVAQCSLGLILPAVEDKSQFSNLDPYSLISSAAASGTDGRALYFFADAKAKSRSDATRTLAPDYLVGEARAMLLKSARAGFAPAQLAVALNSWAEKQPEGYARARYWLTVAKGMPEADKYMAALLLSHPTDGAADAARARELAMAVTRTGYGRQDPDSWQILAAAEAASGNFGAAIRAQKAAARWARMFGWSTEEFERRLQEYRASRAVQDEIVTIPTVARQVVGEVEPLIPLRGS